MKTLQFLKTKIQPFPIFRLMIFIVIGVFFLSDKLSGQKGINGFQKVEVADNIFDAVQDKQGFIWLASSSAGLGKFDGLKTDYLSHNPNNPKSIGSNGVSTITIDKDENIWLGLFGNGIDKYNPVADQFIHYRKVLENNGINLFVQKLLWDKQDRLWIVHQGGIAYGDRQLNNFQTFTNQLDSLKKRTGSSRSTDIIEDTNGTIWILFGSSIAKYNPIDDQLVFYSCPYNVNYFFNLEVDSNNNLWLGDVKDGLFKFNPQTNDWKHFFHIPENKNSLSNNFIIGLFWQNPQSLWIATKKGIDLFDPESQSFEHFNLGNLMVYDFPRLGLLLDIDNNFWVFGAKSYRKKDFQKRFNTLSYQSPFFNGYIPLDSNLILTGNMINGLEIHDLLTNERVPAFSKFPQLKEFDGKGKTIPGYSGNALFEDSKKRWWITHYTPPNLIYRFQPSTKKLDKIKSNVTSAWPLIEGKNKILWGQSWNGLIKIHPDTGLIKVYKHNPKDTLSISDNAIYRVTIDHKNRIWIGTASGGLNLFDPLKETFKNWQFDRNNNQSLSNNTVFDIIEDSKNRIWVATNSGLNQFFPETETFKRYLKENGLKKEAILNIQEDEKGHLWLGHGWYLQKFDPEKNIFQYYDIPAGHQSKKLEDGTLFIGSTYFHPDSIKINPKPPKIHLTNLKIANKKVAVSGADSILKKHIAYTQSIILSHVHNIFSISFIGLNYHNPNTVKYQYQLEGFNNDWFSVSENREATYTNLAAGNYTFKVKAANEDNVWSGPRELAITILPP